MKNSDLSLEEFNTMSNKVEITLNSRPFNSLLSYPNDIQDLKIGIIFKKNF